MRYLSIICLGLLFFVGCDPNKGVSNADVKQRAATAKAMEEANRQVGMPAITNFQERKLAKLIFELRDKENFVCHAYLVNQMTGEVGQYLGKCLGYGLPYSVQFTNPERLVEGSQELGYRLGYVETIQKISQPDPNGLSMPIVTGKP